MSASPIDYAAVAKKYGAVSSSNPNVDYGAIAKQFGAIDSQPAQAQQSDQQQTPEQPGFFKRLGQSLGVPTSMDELQAMGLAEANKPLGQSFLEAIPGGRAIPMVKNVAQTAYKGIKQGAQEAQEAGEQLGSGQITPGQFAGKLGYGTLHAGLQSTPIIGPSIETAGEDIANKNYSGAAGGLTGVIGQVAAPTMASKIPPNSLLGRMLLLGKTPEGAYESAMKPSTTLSQGERAARVSTALQEGIPVSKAGFEKLSSLIDDINSQISEEIANDPNRPINPNLAAKRVDQLKPTFRNQVNAGQDLAAIEQSKQQFLAEQGAKPATPAIPPKPTGLLDASGNPIMDAGTPAQAAKAAPPMTAEAAQSMKQGTYRQLGSKAYGELQTPVREAQKALARGLKEELAQQFPELNDLNARDSRLIDLQDSLEKAVGRISNHQIMGIGTPIIGSAAAAAGSPGFAKVAMVMKAVLDNPVVKSKLAIALSQGKIPSPMVVPKIAGYAGALGKLSQPPSLPFLPGSQPFPSQSPDQ